MKITFAAAAAAPLIAALIAGPAYAHAHLVSSAPAKDASVAAPAALDLMFSEKLEAKFSGVQLMTAAGADVPVAAKVGAKSIHATPKAALKPGPYMVMWHALSADGHKSDGSYNFTVK